MAATFASSLARPALQIWGHVLVVIAIEAAYSYVVTWEGRVWIKEMKSLG